MSSATRTPTRTRRQLRSRSQDNRADGGILVKTTASITPLSSPCSNSIPITPDNEIKTDVRTLVRQVLDKHGISKTRTKGGWCLLEGLIHIASVNNQILLPLIQQYGPPQYVKEALSCRHDFGSPRDRDSDEDANDEPTFDEYDCFRSLCRIIAGQQLAGSAAAAVWSRLLTVVGGSTEDTSKLTPDSILMLIGSKDGGEKYNESLLDNQLKVPAGLSMAKARAIVDLSRHFYRGDLCDTSLLKGDIVDVREKLLKVKGLGPWSCDMFLLFHAHFSDILPLGDLGVAKGTFQCFYGGVRKKMNLKKEAPVLEELHAPFAPYRSLSTYYMWRCADTTAFNERPKKTSSSEEHSSPTKRARKR